MSYSRPVLLPTTAQTDMAESEGIPQNVDAAAAALQQDAGPPPDPYKLTEGASARPRVFFDIDVDGSNVGRIVFELFNDVVPKTAENFRMHLQVVVMLCAY